MTAESPTVAAFRAHVAQRLHVPAAELDDDTAYIRGKHDRGAALAVMMRTKDARRVEVRGWATAAGVVITPSRNLGVLFAEAGVWTQPPGAKLGDLAITLAEDLVWSYGEGATVESSGSFAYPALTLAADGSGSLVFFSSTESSDADPEASTAGGGGGGGGQSTFQDTVSLTADHKATLTRTPFEAITRR
ncbi:MAG: hypothetical protein H7138_19600 [Myxococcales bacterium]|nr:hypothetical protein [Myxococcales bacterium]